MKLNAQRKAYGVVLGLALLALGLDRFVLGGGAMSPQGAAAQAPEAAPAGAGPGAVVPSIAGAGGGAGVPGATLASRLEVLRGVSGDGSRGLFGTRGNWLEPEKKDDAETEEPAPAPESLEQVLAKHRITGVMKMSSGAVVFIDGVACPVGHEFSGVRIEREKDGRVIFVRGSERAEVAKFLPTGKE